jgi:hypothetical protein
MNLPDNWKPKVGWICLILSVFCPAIYLTLPFSGLPIGTIATGVLVAVITGKILFALAIYLLGKKYIDQLKSRFFGRKKTAGKPSLGENDEIK